MTNQTDLEQRIDDESDELEQRIDDESDELEQRIDDGSSKAFFHKGITSTPNKMHQTVHGHEVFVEQYTC